MCGGAETEIVARRNDLASLLYVDRRVTHSDYSLCRRCGVVFAARRERASVAQAYYELFGEIVNKGYAKRVIPGPARAGKIKLAKLLCDQLEQHRLLRPGVRVLHVRCDAGALLHEIKQRCPDTIVHGLDYFPTNLQAAREWGLDDVALLDPAAIRIPFAQRYDIIVCNHTFTHALAPGDDINTLTDALAPEGRLFLYNENDHDLICTTGSPHFSRKEMISYHKQLLAPDSLARFLAARGLRSQLLGHRKFTFTMLAWSAPAAFEPIEAAELNARRAALKKWNAVAEQNRYLIPAVAWANAHGLGGVARVLKHALRRAGRSVDRLRGLSQDPGAIGSAAPDSREATQANDTLRAPP
jgi:2-polyprenyl-3-methyl-5-hydroxy-6-metoxy-1,4-benzoquinol methylase